MRKLSTTQQRRRRTNERAQVSNSETRNREIRPFIKLNDQIQKILVVNRPYKAMMDEEGFITIGASEFLLNFIK